MPPLANGANAATISITDTSEVPSAIDALGSSFDAMPSRWAVRTTVRGPTSKVSRTATVLSDCASARVNVTGPR